MMRRPFERQPLKRYEPARRDGHLYYVRLSTPAGVFYKIGFTRMKSVEERLAYNGDGDEKMIAKVIFFIWLDDAFDVECELHDLLADKVAFSTGYSHEVAPLHKNGQTELYRSDVLRLDTEYTSDEAHYRREGLDEAQVQHSLRTQKRWTHALMPVLWAPLKLLSLALWAYERLSKTDAFEQHRRREARLQVLLQKVANAERSTSNRRESGAALTPPQEQPEAKRLVGALRKAAYRQAAVYIALSQPLETDTILEFAGTWDWRVLSSSRVVPWSRALIAQNAERWVWGELSRNDALPWSADLIAAFATRWDWEGLSANKAVPWSRELIDAHRDRWDWEALSDNRAIPFDASMLAAFQDCWIWDLLLYNEGFQMSPGLMRAFKTHWRPAALAMLERTDCSAESLEGVGDRVGWTSLSRRADLPWSIEFIRQYESKWDWEALSGNESLPWSSEMIEAFAERWVVEGRLYRVGGLENNDSFPWTPELLERYAARFNRTSVAANTRLPWSMELIALYEDRWNWSLLSSNRALPWDREMVSRFRDRWDWGGQHPGLSGNDAVPWTVEMIRQFRNELDWTWLSANTSVPWTAQLLEELKGNLSWSFLSRNESLPWSIALVERFADRWEWGDPGLCANPAVVLPKLERHQVVEVMRSCEQQVGSMDREVAALVQSVNRTGRS